MRKEFFGNVSAFIARLKKESESFKGDNKFETLMEGLSDGTVDFRWGFGGRLRPHRTVKEKPNLIWLRWLVSAPFIYGMIAPIILIDILVSLYQGICFRLWGIPQVRRSKYVVIDRHRLSYLKLFQKLNCVYCGYANGVITYAKSIAGETERYWCPVKHETEIFSPHDFYIEFADFEDPDGWNALHSSGTSNWGK